MAHSPISRLDPSARPHSSGVPIVQSEDRFNEADSGGSLTQLMSTIFANGGGRLSADLVLDLVLNEIVEEACVDAQASAAAIALARDGELVCRATTGENAPDLGVRLNMRSGLSAACVEGRRWQRCDDTETDSRVDAELCRRLGVRSILVAPILKGEELVGIFEILSPDPYIFGDSEVQILQKLSRKVIESVNGSFHVHLPTPEPEPAAPAASAGNDVVVVSTGSPTVARAQGEDFWTSALSFMVVILAVLLGWMVGRAGWQSATRNSNVRPQRTVSKPAAVPANASATNQQVVHQPTATPLSQKAGIHAKPEDLVVYQNGKVVFSGDSNPSDEQGNDTTTEAVGTATQPTKAAGVSALRISPEIASEYLAVRVEPDYPERARQQRIQGPVILDVMVGKDGVVKNVSTMTGDPELAPAAITAVQQWRFHSFFREGHPEEFQTRITVVFRLP